MATVKRFNMSGRERAAILVDSEGLPLTYPNLYSIIHLRNPGYTINTIIAVLEDIELLYLFLDKLEIDIQERFKNKESLKMNEIEAIVNLANFKRDYFLSEKSSKKILSFPKKLKKESIRANIVIRDDCVSKELIYRRLTNFAEYLEWLEIYLYPSSVSNIAKKFKARRPNLSTDESDEYKSFDQEQINIILQTVNPSNQQSIWQSEYVKYRNELIVYILLYLGCRKGELLNIKLTDFTSKNGISYVTIKRNHDDQSDIRLYQPLVKTRSRSLALNLNLKKKIDEYILKYRSTALNAELSDFLILSNQGKPLSINALDKIFTQISKAVLFRVHAHAFRHTWNDKYTEKSSVLISSGNATEAKLENDRAYLMGWIPGSQSARKYSKRAEDRRAIEVGLEIQKKFEEDNE
ncbi:site-specific integrase [Acinetobacter indicus]|uniref:site-specific integrase n=1 Tax=Acinetobacter indicus TaxID=756892 RepID=UPI000FD9C158|nr:site-specific integrase [Acinetobacter indicus]QFS18492.1 site-specific integrase [Acinetobacter indicus]RVT54737.1 site-specific integrase [Acinetobacter indicus]UNW04114.1 site-specific integrase [Acinetobacter indicus]